MTEPADDLRRDAEAVALIAAAQAGDFPAVKRLVEAGAPLERGKNDNGPAFRAAYDGHVECLRYLLDAGADINGRNSINCTPLMGAANAGKLDCVQLLLSRGADRNLVSDSKMTAIDYAHKYPEAKALLSETPEEICYFHKAGDRTLEEIYSFSLKERITYIRKGADGPVEAVLREGFAKLDDESSLRKAFDEHRRRGGTLQEDEVFPGTLSKARLRAGGQHL